ncbi:MAG: NAD(P)H-dependent glycerol-3-phosphate dehydrogenase [Planctomycetota bacterium]
MTPSSDSVTIVGDGAMATVAALILQSRGWTPTILGRNAGRIGELVQSRENRRYLPGYRLPAPIRFSAQPARALPEAGLLINAVPTQFIRKVWADLAEHVPAGVGVASVSKGVERGTTMRPTQVIAEVLQAQSPSDDPDKPGRPLASLSGPTIADELAKCLPATACAASDDPAFAALLQEAFTTQWFRVYTNSDLLGVELAGATKNCIALAAGMLDGLQAGINAKSALLSRGLAEIARLGSAMGARPETFFGVTGVGDLATTCFSPGGRNRTCGEALGRGRKLDEVLEEIPGVVEGVPTTEAVVKLAERYRVEMPICTAIHRVLFDGLDPLDGIGQLMTREPKAESVG